MQIRTLADLKRIPVGTKLRLVRCLMGEVSPERQGRVVAKVQSNAIAFHKEGSDSYSWLTFPKAKELRSTEKGFAVMEGDEVAAEYVFETEGGQ